MTYPAHIARHIASEIGKPQNAAKERVALQDRVRNGTAWTALHILQDEILLTAGRIRNARRAGMQDIVHRHTAALFALLRVKKAMKGRFPKAMPFWQPVGEPVA
ncbi:hypothetical protein L7H23_01075 [Sphingopyxis sp. BSN-002]|uniref:hypothetical protein n=1 Tax=Sphingopyxis sp. BSN-002 TaxID=2911495 RepID=UPI001EDB5B82|nr:hypothetical protein [Sphingopyxis sp. BSN-002]UKK84725.1 hypothetical protein L7H23_01075 [Sphingopyxis sp. BSN-002]